MVHKESSLPPSVSGHILSAEKGRPLKNVCVSNGEKITRTDEHGRYTLPVDKQRHRFIFVIMPGGYSSSQAWYIPVDTGEHFDFTLTPDPKSLQSDFVFAHVTDSHIVTESARNDLPDRDQLLQALNEVIFESEPAFIVFSGDVSNIGTRAQIESYREAIGQVRVPVFTLFGGHDGLEERAASPAVRPFTRNFEAALGPTWFSFNWGKSHFVFLPNEEEFFSDGDLECLTQWVNQDLSLHADYQCIVVTHAHLLPTLQAWLAPYEVQLILHGHWHSSRVVTLGKTLVACTPPLCFGGIDTRPRGYRRVISRNGQLLSALKHFGPKARDSCHNPVLWEHRMEQPIHRAAPVCAANQILISLSDENQGEKSGVCALNAETGSILWNASTDSAIKNSVAVADDRCVAVSVAGCAYSFSIDTGMSLWSSALPNHPHRWVYSSPTMGRDTTYIGTQSGVTALALEDGKIVWHTALQSDDHWPCYIGPMLTDTHLIQWIPRRGVLALSRSMGDILWEQPVIAEYHSPQPLLENDLLICLDISGQLNALDIPTGNIAWKKPIMDEGIVAAMAWRDGQLFLTLENAFICFDASTGKELWRCALGADLADMIPYRRGIHSALARPLFVNDKVVLCGLDGTLQLLTLGGQLLGISHLDSPISATPCVCGPDLIVATYDGRISRLSLATLAS